MKNNARRWVLGFLALLLAMLCVCGGLVYAADPCLFYRAPEGDAVYFNERYQCAGLAKNVPADTVLLGTSMTANYRASHAAETFGGTAVKLTLPDGYLSEFDRLMDVVWRYQTPKRVLFGLDINILIRDESQKTDAMPDYLYNANPLDDIQYLWNKDTLSYSFYALREKSAGRAQPLDEAFTWDGDLWWNHMTALENYQRPELAAQMAAADAYLENAIANAQVVLEWARAHPDTEFDVFFPPYSLLYWDKLQRLGETEAALAAVDAAVRYLLEDQDVHNIRLFFLPAATEITENLDYYCDYIHHSGEAADVSLSLLKSGQYEIRLDQWEKTLSNWRSFVVHYDYEKYWTDAFWWAWNDAHAAPEG